MDAVNIEIVFEKDGEVLLGQGVGRWLEEGQIGIELTYVDQGSSARAVELAEIAVAFIRRTTGRTRPGACRIDA